MEKIKTYTLLDSGHQQKLEQINGFTFIRPAAYAIWNKTLPANDWNGADIIYKRISDKAGEWIQNEKLPENFFVEFGDIKLKIRLTSFGHIGIFPEQIENWEWLMQKISGYMDPKVLNLFAYTGGSTLVASAAGASVTHVDAAKNVVAWAKENAVLSGMDANPIRWIVEDAGKFVERELKRGNKYDGIILDPPSFGRGPQGQVFKVETDLMPLLENTIRLLHPKGFILYTSHTPGFTCETLNNQISSLIDADVKYGDMNLPETSGRVHPAGFYLRTR